MDFFNTKNVCGFNWDDIEVGNNELDHSENYFAQKHMKHEKLDHLELVNKQMGLNDADKIFSGFDFEKENKENNLPLDDQKKETLKNIKLLPEEHANLTLINTAGPTSAGSQPLKEVVDNNDKHEHVTHALDITEKPKKAPANIACMWSSQKPIVCKTVAADAAITKSMPPPHAYEFKDVYERKKQEALRRRLEEERKMRQFHSRPAPNFSACHEQQERRKVVHNVTVPVTPQVLKKSCETEEKRKKKLEEWKRQHKPLKFESREPLVLKEEPFVPKKAPTVIQVRPFNLRSEQRMQERKLYDVAARSAKEEKSKQEEEERKKREEERVRELRKLATFKARPNPFK